MTLTSLIDSDEIFIVVWKLYLGMLCFCFFLKAFTSVNAWIVKVLSSRCRGLDNTDGTEISFTSICDSKRTRAQRQDESQKAVIIDVMKSAGEIASKIWPVVYFLSLFLGKIWPWPVTFIDTWIMEYAWLGCTKYEVCRWNSIRDMGSFFYIDLWPWHSNKPCRIDCFCINSSISEQYHFFTMW